MSAAASHLTGMVGEAHFLEFAASRSWFVYRGYDGHTPCDFVVDTQEGLLRVEVKRAECVLKTDNTRYYQTVTKLDTKQFDFLFLSTPSGWYWIPAEECPKGGTLCVTVWPPPEGDAGRRRTQVPKYEGHRVR